MDIQHVSARFEDEEIRVPYLEIPGVSEGPHLFISGGIHGDEINGIAAVHHFLNRFQEEELQSKLRGKLSVFPVLNPTGFNKVSRRVVLDKQDMNRSFGFDEPSTISQVIAKELTEQVFRHCNMGIDLHDAGGGSVLLPHTRILKNDSNDCMGGCTRSMGQLFGTKILIEREGHPHMMAPALFNEYQVPVITVETGGAQKLFPDFHEEVFQGIKNILISQEMIEGEIKVNTEQYYLKDRYGIRTKEAAVIWQKRELGEYVHAGEEMGDIYFPITQVREKLISPMCGFLFAKWDRGQIPAGKIVYAILESKDCHVKRSTLDHFEPLPQLSIKKFNFSR